MEKLSRIYTEHQIYALSFYVASNDLSGDFRGVFFPFIWKMLFLVFPPGKKSHFTDIPRTGALEAYDFDTLTSLN